MKRLGTFTDAPCLIIQLQHKISLAIIFFVLLFLQIRDFVSEQMSLRGIEFHTEESPQAILKSGDGSLSLKTNKGTVEGFSHVMFATGRKPNTKVRRYFFIVGFILVQAPWGQLCC